MKKISRLALYLSPIVLLALSSCGENSDRVTKLYEEGMGFTETVKGTPEPVYALSYEAIGGDEVMPIGGFYAPFASGGSIDGHDLPNFVSEKYYQALEEAGINMFVYAPERWIDGQSNTSIVKSLELAAEHNIGYFVQSSWIHNELGSQTNDVKASDMSIKKGQDNPKLQNLVNEISKNGSRKAFLGLFGSDEPFLGQLDNLSVLSDAFYRLNNVSGLDLYMNSLGYWEGESNFFNTAAPTTYEKYMELFIQEAKPRMLSNTQYPFTSSETEEADIVSTLFDRLAIYRQYANKNHIPQWRMLQAGGQWNDAAAWIDSVDPYPNEAELLFDVNISLSYGVKAIQYFPLIQPFYFAYKTGNTYDFNRNGLFGADGNKTQWYYYAKRANTQIKAIDHVLMKSSNQGIIIHGEEANKQIVEKGKTLDALLPSKSFRQLQEVKGGDCVVGCFDYKGGTALYVTNYSRKEKADIELSFDNKGYRYSVIQRGVSTDVVGNIVPLRLDAGEGALVVLH